MGIEYYAFALFISGLICLIAILFKVLFANVKRQYKLLDEKESKLLQLYQTVESIMDEFEDQVKAATDEIKEYEKRTAMIVASMEKQGDGKQENRPPASPCPPASPRAERVDMGRRRAANEALVRAEKIVKSDTQISPSIPKKDAGGAVFQRFFDETADQLPQLVVQAATKSARNETVLALAEVGKTDAQIASELGITQNEVKLIIGLNGRK